MIKAFFKKIAHVLGYGGPTNEIFNVPFAGKNCAQCGSNAVYGVPDLDESAGKDYYVWKHYCDYHGPLAYSSQEKQ